jgi:hypothetical protein
MRSVLVRRWQPISSASTTDVPVIGTLKDLPPLL